MLVPYLDVDFFQDEEVERKSAEEFEKITREYIENRFKGADSDSLYSLFNPKQIDLLKRFYKGFSVEEYKELNGTVDLQIQEKNQKVREKLKKISEVMGDINLKDWVYDGMVDAGSVSVKCDLCPRPVRYAHYAVNKKTKECLRFGCNCASDFFNIDKNSLSSMKTIEANMLKDIKLIGCIMDTKLFNEYYRYKGGYVGKVLKSHGREGLLELRSFMVKWDKDGKLVGDEEKDQYPITYGDGKTVELKSLMWIKEHIVSCMNGDLGGVVYDSLEKRDVIRKAASKDDKSQLNTMVYINYAVAFYDVGLPIPYTLLKKMNSILLRITHQHSPDRIKYLQELLIEHNFENSSLLTRAFTDFMVNYLASLMKVEDRDAEMEYWGIRGAGTFYKTVLSWELAMHKMEDIKEMQSLVSKNLISEYELGKFSGGVSDLRDLREYVKDSINLFISKKPVVRTDANVAEGYSKYTLKNNDKKIALNINKGNRKYNLQFRADMIPYHIALYYKVVEDGYKKLLKETIQPISKFLNNVQFIETEEEMAKYLSLINIDRTSISHRFLEEYSSSNYDKVTFGRMLSNAEIVEGLDELVYKQYKGKLKKLKKALLELKDELDAIIANLKMRQDYRFTITQVNDDYDDLIVQKKKTNKDYFLEYCELLSGKRGTQGMQLLLHSKRLNHLKSYKSLEPFYEIFDYIDDVILKTIKKKNEKLLYKELNLNLLKGEIAKFINTPDLDTFIRLLLYLYGHEYHTDTYRPYIFAESLKPYNSYDIDNQNYYHLRNIMFENDGLPLCDDAVVNSLKEEIQDSAVTLCKDEFKDKFETFLENLKGLYESIKDEDSINFISFFKLLANQKKGSEKEVMNCATVDEYRQYLEYKVGVSPVYTKKVTMYNLFSNLDIYEGFEDFSLDTFMAPIMIRLEELYKDRVGKSKIIGSIKVYLKEHIKFFEVDVEGIRNSVYKMKKRSDESIRREYAFKDVKFEKSSEVIYRFIENLEKSGTIESDEYKVIEELKNLGNSSASQFKKYAEVLRVLMYNKKLIFNHFEYTHQLLVNLDSVDLNMFSEEDLKALRTILGRYYLLKTDVAVIHRLLKNNNLISFDSNKYIKEIPEPKQISLADAKEFYLDYPDSTGKTGVQKANEVYHHSGYENLSTFLKTVVKSVSMNEYCTKEKLVYVNMAYENVGLGTCDTVIIPEGYKKPESSQDSSVTDAINVSNHPDFGTLPDYLQNIVKTVTKTQKCSEKQKKYVDKAKNELKM